MDIYDESLKLHQKLSGKFEVKSKTQIRDKDDLALIYTPGVAQVCKEIAAAPSKVYDLTIKKNTIAIVSDGSAVLGLGNIGPEAALPVMEGKALLFKEYANIDAFPICLNTQDTDEIIKIVKNIMPVFAGINLEDIAAPRCFQIEKSLQNIGIPVFHDDQHGTAIVLLAALINSAILAGKDIGSLKVVVNGAGAAGSAIAQLLLCVSQDPNLCKPVKEIIICDSKGIISRSREDIVASPTTKGAANESKKKLAQYTNKNDINGSLADALVGADVFVGVSQGNVLTEDMIKTMNSKPIIFALANPTPEIHPVLAEKAGAFIVATGRSDFPNQVNNALVFPGIFRGALDVRASIISNRMKVSAAHALAQSVEALSVDNILPQTLDRRAAENIAAAVKIAFNDEMGQN